MLKSLSEIYPYSCSPSLNRSNENDIEGHMAMLSAVKCIKVDRIRVGLRQLKCIPYQEGRERIGDTQIIYFYHVWFGLCHAHLLLEDS
jgi:hypothetical protein